LAVVLDDMQPMALLVDQAAVVQVHRLQQQSEQKLVAQEHLAKEMLVAMVLELAQQIMLVAAAAAELVQSVRQA
jgi:hypothetical protein